MTPRALAAPVCRLVLCLLLVLLIQATHAAQVSAQAPDTVAAPQLTCPTASALQLESGALAGRGLALDAQLQRWPLTWPVVGLLGSVVAFGALAASAEHSDSPQLFWGLSAVPAAGAVTSLGFLGYRIAKRHPYASERKHIARRQAQLRTQRELLAQVGCADPGRLAHLVRAQIGRIDAEVDAIDRRAGAISIGGPMALTVAGGVTLVGFGLATTISWLMTTALTHDPHDPDPALFAGLGIGMMAGAAMATTGLAWTVRRKHERNELVSEARRLRERKQHFELMIQPSVSAQHVGLALGGRL